MSFQFDELYYRQNNTDVNAAIEAGWFESGQAHYNQFGWIENRDPNVDFDTSYYLDENPDVGAAVLAGDFESPLQHFLVYGAAEGRAPSAAAAELLALFDEAEYLAANPDVADAIANGDFQNAVQHYQLYGQFENRPGLPELPPVGETFELTQGPDTGPAFQGGDGDDVYNASTVQTSVLPIQTLNTADDIDGGGGRNTLNAQLVDPYVVPAGLTNIQVLNISSPGGVVPFLLPPPTLDVLNADSIDTINFRNPIQNITINNLQTALDTVGIYDDVVVGTTSTINHVGATTDGIDDRLAINLRNATDSTLILNHTSLDLNAGYEIFDINSTGSLANSFTLVNGVGGPRDVTITGNNALTLNGISFDTLRTLDVTTLQATFAATFTGDSVNADVVIDGSTFANNLIFNGTATGTGILCVTTFDGSDALTFTNHSGDVVSELGEGDNTLNSTGGSGNLQANAGAGDDTFTVDTHIGDVTIDGGDGNNVFNIGGTGTSPFNGPAAHDGDVTGVVSLTGGDGDDTFNFYQLNNATNFNAGDSVDGGGGNNLLRFDIYNPGSGPVDLLDPGTTIANIQTIRVTGDLYGDNGAVLDVDWVNSGSANRLELAADAMGTINVINLDFANNDIVAVYNGTTGGAPLNLTLERGFVTAPAFNLELNDGVVVNNLNVGTGSDLLNLVSLGDSGDLNQITNASNINAGVVDITGDTNLLVGTSLANGFDQDNAVINAVDFDANLWFWAADGNQTINDGAGDDFYVLSFTGTANSDVLNLSEGSDTVWIRNANTDGNGGGLSDGSVHHVNGFSTSGDGADVLAVWLSGAGITTLDDASGSPVSGGIIDADWNISGGDDAIIRNVEVGDILNLSGTGVNFLKFTTGVTGATDIEDLFDSAIGGGSIVTGVGGSNMLASAYDLDAEQAVFFVIDGPGATITAGDDIDGLVTMSMSYDDYLAFDASNVAFVA